MAARIDRNGVVYSVGSVYTDGGVVIISIFTEKEDADTLFTRLQDRRFPGDGIKEHFMVCSPLFIRKMVD